ncbi:MAG: tRNA epoxyqueuosine(34) reductase QueG, partial [Halanaerobiales bacterium]
PINFSKSNQTEKFNETNETNESNKTNRSKQYISLYARSKDYHFIMEEKMNQLIDFLKELRPDIELKAYCDTGAILDREVAYRAGLGWIGKNNNLINPEYGSFLVLGEIITNLDLLFDQPIESKCNDCNLCLKTCPTQAFNKPYHLDSEKCLSYITQKKGYLSEKERKSIKNRLWGCDSCLSVCPYNQSIPMDLHEEFEHLIEGDIKQILKFKKGNLPEEWEKSAISWRGLRILKRNALINIANNPELEDLDLLNRELSNPSPIIRTYVIWALEQLFEKTKNHQIIKLIKKQYHIERDDKVLQEIKLLFNKYSQWGDLND